MDDDADGLADWLAIEIGLDIATAMEYGVIAMLANPEGELLTVAQASATLTAPRVVEVTFDGRKIRGFGDDGPYVVHLGLYDEDGDLIVSENHVSAAYSVDSFEKPPVALTGTYADRGVDSNGNGLFDQLVVDAATEVTVAADYLAYAQLVDGEGSVLDVFFASVALPAGTSTLSLAFDGTAIGQSDIDGPYFVRHLSLKRQDALAEPMASVEDAHATAAYLVSQFEGFDPEPPVANDDEATTPVDTAVTIELVVNDTTVDGVIDLSSIEIVETPLHGQLAVHDDGNVTYSPDGEFVGRDGFTYTVRNDLGTISNEASVAIGVGNLLGEVRFIELLDLDLSSGVAAYSFQTAYQGVISLEAEYTGPADGVQLMLCDEDSSLLVTSWLSNDRQRIDWFAEAGTTFIVKVVGTSSDVDLRIINLVQISPEGTEATVFGTADDDTFELSIGPPHIITINGVQYDSNPFPALNFLFLFGAAGDDTLRLAELPSHAVFDPDVGIIHLPGFVVHFGDIESIILDATTAILGAPATSVEGTPISLTSTVTGADLGTTQTYAWEISKAGSPFAAGTDPEITFTPDDDASYEVTLTVTDDEARVAGVDTKTIFVTNVAPTILLDGNDAGAEGAEYSLTLGTITDPGNDTVTQWIVHWGDGATDTYASGGEKTHTYTDDNPSVTASDPYTITVDLADEDGIHSGAGSKEITVSNVAPTVNAGADATVDESSLFTSSGSFMDPGADNWTATVDYGDGSGVQPLTVNTDKTFDLSHTYADAADYTVTVTVSDDDTGSGSETLLVTVTPDGPIDLGPIDFLLLEHQSLANGTLYFQMETTHEGSLTLQVDIPKPSKSARLKLYDADPVETTGLTPLVNSTLDEDGNQRIERPTSAGTVYYVEVYGDNADFDVRFANLISHIGTTVTVHGTDSSDTFEFNAAASRDVTINGIRYHFDDAQVELVTFNGGDGYDMAILDDSVGDDTLTAEATHAVFSNSDQTPGFTVTMDGFEELQAKAKAGGHDEAFLYDSDAKDKFKSEPAENYAKMYGGRMYNRVKFFDLVEAFSSGEKDLARIFDTQGNDTFDGQQDVSWLRTDVFDVGVHNFRQVIAYAMEGGNDEATLKDSVLNDEVYLKGHKSEIFDRDTKGEVYKITARRFDFVHADGSEGDGYDKVKMWETPHDNHVEAADNWARLSAQKTELEMLYDVLAFEFVKVRASTGGNDTSDVTGPLDFELLFEDGWDV